MGLEHTKKNGLGEVGLEHTKNGLGEVGLEHTNELREAGPGSNKRSGITYK